MKFNVVKALEILERTPEILKIYLGSLSEDWTICNEGEETWSAFHIVGHLIHGEKTDWAERLQLIMSDGEIKTFTPFDRFAQFDESKDKKLVQLLNEFDELRAQNIALLKSFNIQESDFERRAIHPELGEITLRNLLATWVTHDLGHISQIARVMAKQYKEEVGPWTKYISILNK
ncbi:DinB family protein [Flavobacteriaceae sp. LMIT009]